MWAYLEVDYGASRIRTAFCADRKPALRLDRAAALAQGLRAQYHPNPERDSVIAEHVAQKLIQPLAA